MKIIFGTVEPNISSRNGYLTNQTRDRATGRLMAGQCTTVRD